jgi:hypothetical protein
VDTQARGPGHTPTVHAIDFLPVEKGATGVQCDTVTTRPITVAETLLFLRQAAALWGEDEHTVFVDFIAANPEAGEVIPGTGGIRKVRWSRPGSGNVVVCA